MISTFDSGFPADPTDGDRVTIGGITYQWYDSVGAWVRIDTGGGGGGKTYSFIAPLSVNSFDVVSFNWSSMSSLPN